MMPVPERNAAAPLAPSDLSPGTLLAGRYRVLALAGEGGSGCVYRARDLVLDVDVALKVLSSAPTPTALARFKREARVTRRIGHPLVARVFDVTLDPGAGLYLLTMEWIDGPTLSSRISQAGPLRGAAAVRLFQGLAEALAAAHRAGIIHRDVKPDNVLIDSRGQPHLIDFGVAAQAGEDGLTLDGFVPGTPAFMAPEQEQGQRCGAAADVYALGLTVLHAVGDDRTRLPVGVRRVLGACLEPEPSRRLQDGAAVSRALQRASRPGARTLVPVLVAALLLAAAAAASLFSGGRAPRTPLFVRPFALEGVDDGVARAVSEWMAWELSRSRDLRVTPPYRHARPPADASQLEGRLVDGELQVRVVRPGEADAPWLGSGQPQAQLLTQTRALLGPLRVRAGAGEPADGARLVAHPAALEHFGRALGALERHDGLGALESARRAAAADPGFLRAQLLIVMLTQGSGFSSRAEGQRAVAALSTPPATASPRDQALATATLRLLFATHPGDGLPMRRYLQDNPEDLLAHRLGARLARGPVVALRRDFLEAWIRAAPGDPEPHNLLGYAVMGLEGDLALAEHHFREYARLDPQSPNAHDSLADVLIRQGRHADADASLARALTLAPAFPPALARAAECALMQDRLDLAAQRQAAAESRIVPDSPAFARVARSGVALRLIAGDRAGALEYLRQLMQRPGLGGRVFALQQLAALIHALDGNRGPALHALQQAEAAAATYDVEAAPLAPLYLESLVADGDPVRLAELERRLENGTHRLSAREIAVLRARAALARRDPSAALTALAVVPESAFTPEVPSVSAFTRAWFKARALQQLGRTGEARAAYLEAFRRRGAFDLWPESADRWVFFLDEAAAALEGGGEEDPVRHQLLERRERLRVHAAARRPTPGAVVTPFTGVKSFTPPPHDGRRPPGP